MKLVLFFFFGLFNNEIIFFFNCILIKYLDNKYNIMVKCNKIKLFIFNHNLNSISSWVKIVIYLSLIIKFITIIYNLYALDFYNINYNNLGEGEISSSSSNQNPDMSNASSSQNKTEGVNTASTNSSIVNNVEVDIKKNPNINLNTPNINISVPGVIPAMVGGAAIKAGIEFSKHTPSIPGKIAVKAATAALATGLATFGSKVGSNLGDVVTSSTSANSVNKFLPDINILTGHVDNLDKYPLNLLPDMLTMNFSAILFLFIILNVFIAITIKNNNIDIFNYLPKWLNPNTNILGKFIQYMFLRYLNIWYESRKFFLIFSWVMILIALLVIQLGLFIIINSG